MAVDTPCVSRNNSICSATEMEDDDQVSRMPVHMHNIRNDLRKSQTLRHELESFVRDSEVKPNFASMVHHKWRKMWRRDSAEITPDDPSYKGIYLGNVVTTWAKGDGCLERPASALWKNHCQGRGSIKMVISVAPSGLKAQTREHGLTEYWANRLTWCGVPPDYPKLFCWIYRHEGRKLKQELRCHAVLCSKDDRAVRLANSLRNRLTEALFDFKKEKILRQNARLSIIQSLYNTSATKRRLVLLTSNSQNYKPPLERSKSAPKLSCIEEFEEDDNEENYLSNSHPTIPESPELVPASSKYVQRAPSPPLQTVRINGGVVTLTTTAMVEESSTDPVEDEDDQVPILFEEAGINATKAQESSPTAYRNSYSAVSNSQNSTSETTTSPRRPHTVPMDAKLNLPYMTGYDKVMQLLDMPGDTHHLLLDDEDEDNFTIDYSGPNSDPVASSPGSEDESAVDSYSEEDDFKMRHRRTGSCREKRGRDDQSSPEEEINDNVSDESGYSEEANLVNDRRNSKDEETDLSLNLDPMGSSQKSSTKNHQSSMIGMGSTIIISGGEHEPVIFDSMIGSPKNHFSNSNNNSPSSNNKNNGSDDNNTTTLVVYDNLCFEI